MGNAKDKRGGERGRVGRRGEEGERVAKKKRKTAREWDEKVERAREWGRGRSRPESGVKSGGDGNRVRRCRVTVG